MHEKKACGEVFGELKHTAEKRRYYRRFHGDIKYVLPLKIRLVKTR